MNKENSPSLRLLGITAHLSVIYFSVILQFSVVGQNFWPAFGCKKQVVYVNYMNNW